MRSENPPVTLARSVPANSPEKRPFPFHDDASLLSRSGLGPCGGLFPSFAMKRAERSTKLCRQQIIRSSYKPQTKNEKGSPSYEELPSPYRR